MMKKIFRWKFGLIALIPLLLFGLFFLKIFMSLPRLMTTADYNPPLLTEVYDQRGEKIGEFFEQRRRLFKYEDMPLHLIQAFTAAEDGSFFSHSGLNYRAILRAFLVNLKEGRKVQGGSTITQQLARTLLLSSEKTYTRKLKEAILALRMESVLSKQDILYIYLNQIYMGRGAYGAGTAARVYFRKPVKNISLAEAALLAGLPKAPSRFSPIRNPSRAKARQIYVLSRMREEGFIDKETWAKAAASPLKIYLREDFNSRSPYYLETVRRLLLKKFSSKELLEGGLRIETAMDWERQRAAQAALRKGLEAIDRRRGLRPFPPPAFFKELTEDKGKSAPASAAAKAGAADRAAAEAAPKGLEGEAPPPAPLSETEEGEKRQKAPAETAFLKKSLHGAWTEKVAADLKERLKDSFIIPGANPALLKEVPDEEAAEATQSSSNIENGPQKAAEEATGLAKSAAGTGAADPLNPAAGQTGGAAENLVGPTEKAPPFPWQDYLAMKKEGLSGQVFSAILTKVEKESMTARVPWGSEKLFLKDLLWAVPVEEKQEKGADESLGDLRAVFKKNQIISLRMEEPEEKRRLVPRVFQKPSVQGALISFDLETADILALTGGYDYADSQFNRAYQARRQPGSVFKPFIYGAALEKGFHPATVISDAPVVFTHSEAEEGEAAEAKAGGKGEDGEEEGPEEMWKPSNISERFYGDLLFRTALVRSLNVPAVKILKKIGLKHALFYTRSLGIFSPLNPDYTTALGSSALTLYEILKAYSVFARLGKGMSPVLVRRVEDSLGETLLTDLSLDTLFEEETAAAEQFLKEERAKRLRRLKKTGPPRNAREKAWQKILSGGAASGAAASGEAGRSGPASASASDQRLPAVSSYLMTDLLQAVISDPEGTGALARALNRRLAGKTGTTDGFYDAWFAGYSPFLSAAVWTGFDQEKTMGGGETGSRAALPVWMDYMEEAHKDLPDSHFPVPEGIVFMNIDSETGALASPDTKKAVYQAFIEGETPQAERERKRAEKTAATMSHGPPSPAPATASSEEEDFIKEDLSH